MHLVTKLSKETKREMTILLAFVGGGGGLALDVFPAVCRVTGVGT